MANPEIQAVERNEQGKAALRTVREAGRVPAIVYGQGKEATQVAVDEKEMRRLVDEGIQGRMVNLILNGEKKAVLVQEVQRKVISGNLVHVDFNAVDLTQKLQTIVTISILGEHGKDTADRVLVHSLREVEVRCLPTNIPEYIELDVSELAIGESVKAEALALPEGVELVTDPEAVIVSATMAKTVEEEEPETDEELAEPEVIGEKSEEEDADQ